MRQMNFKLHVVSILLITTAIEVQPMGWIFPSSDDPNPRSLQRLHEILTDPEKIQKIQQYGDELFKTTGNNAHILVYNEQKSYEPPK